MGISLTVASLLLLAAFPPPHYSIITVVDATTDRRLNVLPSQSIATEILTAHAAGNPKPRFTLHATDESSPAANSNNIFTSTTGTDLLFEVHVREAEPAITSKTTTSVKGGKSHYVDFNNVATMLVSDEVGVMALLSVDKKDGKVNGIVKKGKSVKKFTQKSRRGGEMAVVANATDFVPPAWSCGVSSEQELNNSTTRHLVEHDHEDDHFHSHHDHSDHDHSHHDHSHHDHSDHNFDPSNDNAFSHVQHSLRGSEMRIGKRRRVQGSSSYAYWVDIYIEIDYALCNDNAELALCNAGTIGPNTINYVNALFVGANTIYESEIDTHLNVLHIDLNTNYDTATSTSDALSTMMSTYSRSSWHFTSPTGVKPDLHHALLSKNLGGGIAYIGVICSSTYGFGLSASLSGSYRSMGNSVVWDMNVFMHELGHNFNSDHTHSYSPVIDTCGSSCPAQLPLAKSATIMSYCHLCSGSYSNIQYTFGGKYSGVGLRSDMNSYSNSPLAGLGTVSIEPRRVNAMMWSHVSSRGTCTSPSNAGSPTTSISSKKPTSKPTSPKPTVPCLGMNIEVKILTDNYPGETTWTLTNTCGVQSFMSGGPYSQTSTLYSVTACLPAGAYNFTINDSAGDGLCCGYGAGSYTILVGGVTVASGETFGRSDTKLFGTCPVGPTVQPTAAVGSLPPTGTPTTSSPTSSPTVQPTATVASLPPTRTPTTSSPTSSPTVQPTATVASLPPTRTPTDKPISMPSSVPTVKPTSNPTSSKPTTTRPTRRPTNMPSTRRPTNKPTSKPTRTPTSRPTTRIPTNKPTTEQPTAVPTKSPTSVPSQSPTTTPTNTPTTSSPSSSPSQAPTTVTESPSENSPYPNESPSFTPTDIPNFTPTIFPTQL